jgi:hypothetical protein
MKTKAWIVVGTIMFVWTALLSFSGTALSEEWPIGTFYYEIARKNNHTGILKIVSKQEGGDVVVETEEWLRDTGYCHASKRREVWQKKTLMAFESSSAGSCSAFVRLFRPSACPWEEFGDPITVSVVRKDKELLQEATLGQRQHISGDAVPTNFLNPTFRGSNHTIQVIDPITGELGSVRISPQGVEELTVGHTSVKTERYLVQKHDSQDRELWYNMRGVWIKMLLTRDFVTFTTADPAKMESKLTSFISKSGCLRKLPKYTK